MTQGDSYLAVGVRCFTANNPTETNSSVAGVPKLPNLADGISYFAVNHFAEDNRFADSNTTGDLRERE